MRTKIIVGIAAIAVVVGGVYWFAQKPGGGTGQTSQVAAQPATPPGVTMRVYPEPGFVATAGFVTPPGRAFADSRGYTLYITDKDQPGQSSCTGDCAKAWPPLAAPADAHPIGDWSLVEREGGVKQWAYRGKPLYTYANDLEPDPRADGPNCAVRLCSAFSIRGNGVDTVWHVATLQPLPSIPDGIDVREIADAQGQGLVDPRGLTLYSFGGDAKSDKESCAPGQVCTAHWLPLDAPALANAAGDFSIVERADGTQQWAYKGRPLYRYDGDLEPGHANGDGVDKRYQVALVLRYFQPTQVALRSTAGIGKILTNAQGMTLYRRDGYRYEVGGHSLPHSGFFGSPTFGKFIGTSGCDAECLKTWKPFVAAADAKASGYWEILAREDGSKQWAYKGYALYTYVGDKKPGDLLGNDVYDFLVNSNLQKAVSAPVALTSKTQGAGALFWAYMPP